MSLPVRILFIAHGIVTAAAGIVLIAAPALIPSTVGIALPTSANLLPYLLGGVELYVDRPKPEWPRSADGSLAMVTRRLDLDDLLREPQLA